jgi:uncharacterized membrane protein YbhN (UPF0104 family)
VLALSAWKSLVARHLYTYLALVCGLVVVLGAVFARGALAQALGRLQPEWLLAALGLSLLNYLLRFTKWARMLADCGIHVAPLPNARLYFASLAMVVTPGRLGELYKLVFLRRLHGIETRRSLAPLVMERITDALAVLLLILPRLVGGFGGLGAVLAGALVCVGIGGLLARPGWPRRAATQLERLPGLRRRGAEIESALKHQRVLLTPRPLSTALLLSLVAWWAECWGLLCILRGLGVSLSPVETTWIYAAATLLGNLTFLPGGLGFTEVSLVALLGRVGVDSATGLAATVLVRAATLWFAVLLGLSVSLVFRRALQWDAVREEAAQREA